MTENPLRQKLLKLAEALIDVADGSPLEDRIDILKVCTTLYLGDDRRYGKKDDDEPAGRGMREWQQAIKGDRTDA